MRVKPLGLSWNPREVMKKLKKDYLGNKAYCILGFYPLTLPARLLELIPAPFLLTCSRSFEGGGGGHRVSHWIRNSSPPITVNQRASYSDTQSFDFVA